MRGATSMRKILITGAGLGFGFEAAMRLAEKGLEVVTAVETYAHVGRRDPGQ
jgi:NAD(P)-dependent dehydrogenase (short-subunit alcohol dehydrogenase family)